MNHTRKLKKSIYPLFIFFAFVVAAQTAAAQVPDPYDKDADSISSESKIFVIVEVEAHFPGGDKAWLKFLVDNLDGDVAVKNGAPAGKYTVLVQFVVDKDGSLTDIKALTNHGFGMEAEVIKLLKRSPKWETAIMKGKPVKAYRKQPVTFQVEVKKSKRKDRT